MQRHLAIILLLALGTLTAGCIGSEVTPAEADASNQGAPATPTDTPPAGARAASRANPEATPAEPAPEPIRSESKFGNGTAGLHAQGEPIQGELASWDVGFDEPPTLLVIEVRLAPHAEERGIPPVEAAMPTLRFYGNGELIHEGQMGTHGASILAANKTGPWRIELIPGDTVTPGFDWCAVATQYYGEAAHGLTSMSNGPPRILGEECAVS